MDTDTSRPPGDEGPLFDDDVPDMPSVGMGPHFEMHPVVFPAGAVIVLSLVLLTVLIPGPDLRDVFDKAVSWIGSTFGWLYVASLTGFLVFAVWLASGKYGGIKLGADDEKPEFGRLAWFSMLFSAGMGIGLVFWSVAEPVYHFNTPPPGFAEGLNPSRLSMAVTIFHWGLHPWALYAVVGLALAYFGFRRRMPLGFRSLLYPLLGDRVWGRTGDAIDTLAVIATLTGVATSLGLGAKQVNAGLAFLFGMPIGPMWQVLLIASITAVATVSVVLGLSKGIRRLSEINMVLAGSLMVMVIFGGGFFAFLGSSIENTGGYLQILPLNSFRTGTFSNEGYGWLNAWTVFYWAWWISWSPFVGMFIARVSRGRTIREFVIGVLLVPTGVGILWLTAFGAGTLRAHTDHVEATEAYSGLVEEYEYARSVDPDAAIEAPEHPDGSLPTFLVQRRAASGPFAIAESGAYVGPAGGVYEPRADGAFVETATGRVVVLHGGTLHEEGSLEVFAPARTFDGAYAGDELPLTPVEYLSAPILSGTRTTTIDTTPTVLFALLQTLFDSRFFVLLSAGIATTCIILFFVTSSDSASMVIDIIASGGNPDPPVGTRLFWAITEGVVASALLLAGGLRALQAASITAALPFTIVLLAACWCLVRALREEPV